MVDDDKICYTNKIGKHYKFSKYVTESAVVPYGQNKTGSYNQFYCMNLLIINVLKYNHDIGPNLIW